MNYPNDPTEIKIATLIFAVVILYFFYFYFTESKFLRNLFGKNSDHIKKELFYFLTKKLSGFLILGIIPGILYSVFISPSFSKFGLSFFQLTENLNIILILVVIIVAILYFNQKSNRENNSLQMNISEWNVFLFSLNCIGWIMYLTAYEFLFRGILLTECYNEFGFWPAIAINVTLYSAIHMVYGKEQAIGALIFGTIACYFTLIKGTILIPIFMHIALSLFSDYFSIKLNKKLTFIPIKNKDN